MRACLIIVFACALGCSSSGLPGAADMSTVIENDGSVAADLASAQCQDVYSTVSQWLNAHRSCNNDSDCTIVETVGCLPAACGDYFNTSVSGPFFDSLLSYWKAHTYCWPDGCAPCTGMKAVGPASCVGGVCTGPKR